MKRLAIAASTLLLALPASATGADGWLKHEVTWRHPFVEDALLDMVTCLEITGSPAECREYTGLAFGESHELRKAVARAWAKPGRRTACGARLRKAASRFALTGMALPKAVNHGDFDGVFDLAHRLGAQERTMLRRLREMRACRLRATA